MNLRKCNLFFELINIPESGSKFKILERNCLFSSSFCNTEEKNENISQSQHEERNLQEAFSFTTFRCISIASTSLKQVHIKEQTRNKLGTLQQGLHLLPRLVLNFLFWITNFSTPLKVVVQTDVTRRVATTNLKYSLTWKRIQLSILTVHHPSAFTGCFKKALK